MTSPQCLLYRDGSSRPTFLLGSGPGAAVHMHTARPVAAVFPRWADTPLTILAVCQQTSVRACACALSVETLMIHRLLSGPEPGPKEHLWP